MFPRWCLRVRVEWDAADAVKGERWWKLWRRCTGERMEREIEVWDAAFYALTGLLWAIWHVAR